MEYLIAEFLSLPSRIIWGILGGIVAVLGCLIGWMLSKMLKLTKHKSHRLMTICAVIIICFYSSIIQPKVRQYYIEPFQATNAFKKDKFLSSWIKVEPEIESELKAIINNPKNSTEQIPILTANLVRKYFPKYLLTASDETVHRMIAYENALIKRLQDTPELCVSYYMGLLTDSDTEKLNQLVPGFEEEIKTAKANITRSSITIPSVLPQNMRDDEEDFVIMLELLNDSYKKRGYEFDWEEWVKVKTLPSAKGCKVITEFYDTIASLKPKQASYIIKMIYHLIDYYSEQHQSEKK